MERLKDKVAIVTGSSSGIGRGIAKEVGKEGAKVVCSDVREEPREGDFIENDIATHKLIQEKGGESTFVECDVSDLEDVKSLVESAVEEFGRLDVMVNNAGVFTRMDPIHKKTEEDLDKTMNVNFRGVWNGCQQAIIQFLEQGDGGKIINTVSLGGKVGLAQEPAYCASKGAVALLTKQLAIDYGEEGITVNGICPSWGKTSMCRDYYENEETRRANKEATPLGRWFESEEIGRLVVFLASEDSDYMTGGLIPIDGGYLAK